MGLLGNMFKGSKRYSRSFIRKITLAAEALNAEVSESLKFAGKSNVLEEKKARLDFAMARLVELIRMANEYSFLDFRKISSIYDQVRDVRNDIKDMEAALYGKPGKTSPAEEPVPVKSVHAAQPEQAACPYCGHIFPVMPLRKSNCPSCNKTVFVWYSTTENIRKLISREEASRLEKEVTEHIEKYELLNKQETLDKSDDEILAMQAGLIKENPMATLDDAYLFLLNTKIKETADTAEKSRLHYLKALLLDSLGNSFFEDLYECRKLELLNLKSHGILRKVQVITGPDACHVCKTDSDTIFTLSEALDKMPLPHRDCIRPLHGSEGFCRCTYLVIHE